VELDELVVLVEFELVELVGAPLETGFVDVVVPCP
jgi:hypothetical protein